MNQIACCDWQPDWARWSYLAQLGLPAVSHRKNFPKSLIINPLLTKLVRSRWLDIVLGTSNSSGSINLGVLLDAHLSFFPHVNNICHALLSSFHSIGRIGKYLMQVDTEFIVNAFVTSKLD